MISGNRFRNNLLLSYSAIFLAIAVLIITYQFNREKEYRIDTLNDELYNITRITDNYIRIKSIHQSSNYHLIDSLIRLLPHPNLRISLIDDAGYVLYDSFVHEYTTMENHLSRPEIIEPDLPVSEQQQGSQKQPDSNFTIIPGFMTGITSGLQLYMTLMFPTS